MSAMSEERAKIMQEVSSMSAMGSKDIMKKEIKNIRSKIALTRAKKLLLSKAEYDVKSISRGFVPCLLIPSNNPKRPYQRIFLRTVKDCCSSFNLANLYAMQVLDNKRKAIQDELEDLMIELKLNEAIEESGYDYFS